MYDRATQLLSELQMMGSSGGSAAAMLAGSRPAPPPHAVRMLERQVASAMETCKASIGRLADVRHETNRRLQRQVYKRYEDASSAASAAAAASMAGLGRRHGGGRGKRGLRGSAEGLPVIRTLELRSV